MGGHMKFGMWIMATGLMLGTGLFLMAVFDVDPWKDPGYNYAPPIAAGAPSPHVSDRFGRACSSCHQIINPQRDLAIPFVPIPSGAISPHRDGRESQACSRCHRILARKNIPTRTQPQQNAVAQGIPVAIVPPLPPLPSPPAVRDNEWHEKFRPIRFQGKILAVAGKNLSLGRNNINILINDGINQPSWYNLAPEWYLKSTKCNVSYGLYVKGTAFRELGGTNTLRYGQNLSVNGQYCPLRNSHMEGLWNPATRHHNEEEAELE
ncbi:MAG: Histidine kinase [Magnetococcales bacterium]|nr:Histidine kinase [Magnetococcales bacterium]